MSRCGVIGLRHWTKNSRSEDGDASFDVSYRASYTFSVKIGVLAIQGAVSEHIDVLRRLGVDACDVRTADELNRVDGLIIPGGESTAIGHVMKKYDVGEAFVRRVREGMPVYGTCAGAILMAKKVSVPEDGQRVEHFPLMDIEIARNDYGRQVDSFIAEIRLEDKVFSLREDAFINKMRIRSASLPLRMVFIRAPRIKKTGQNVRILAECRSEPVLCLEGNILVSTFHPELTEDTRVHEYFLDMVRHHTGSALAR